jgi:uncharacterized protein (TIGR03437 family)
MSYEDARVRGPLIASVTSARRMPPWKPEPGFTEYQGERRLTGEQIDLIRQWVEQGMPEGDPGKLPPLPEFPADWYLGQPDLVAQMPEPFDVPAGGPDLYWNFVLPLNLPEDRWVSAIEVRPGVRGVVHHVLVFTDTTGAARRADAADPLVGFSGLLPVSPDLSLAELVDIIAGKGSIGTLGGWVPGTYPSRLPEGLAMRVPKGADLVLQTHFHPNGQPQRETTVIGLYFAKSPPQRTLVTLQTPALFGSLWGIDIPAGEPSYLVRDSFVLPIDVDAVDVQAHAHYLARDVRLTATLPGGEVRVLLWISDWELDWQDRYVFQEFIRLPAGTRLDAEIRYDNSAGNPHNPFNPPIRVEWGEESTDEMGTLILTAVPAREADLPVLYAALLAQALFPIPRDPSLPSLISSGVVDGAGARYGPLVPGKIIVLYGDGLGPPELTHLRLDADSRVAAELAGTRVRINGTPAPLIYASAGQTAAIVPYDLDGRSGAQLEVEYNGRRSHLIAFPVAAAAPSLFTTDYTGRGQAAALNQDGITGNGAANPAERGSIVSLFATGEGQTDPPGVDGQLAFGVLPKPRWPVTAQVAGQPAEVQYAGGAPTLVAGVMQVNVRVPADTPSGNVPVKIFMGGASSQDGVTIVVK